MSAGDVRGVRRVAGELAMLKREFARTYRGNSHIQEVLPSESAAGFPVDRGHLLSLHRFAECNPIYHNSFGQEVAGISCVAYEGDINAYWLDSIKHGSSCQPFYPTWILSAYVAVLHAKNLGCNQLVDVGSGDGRIAYCGTVLGLDSHSIEIDGSLAELQSSIAGSTGMDFQTACADATVFDYSSIGPGPAAFFIGGLPQMGGDILADAVVGKILKDGHLKKTSTFVLAGARPRKGLPDRAGNGGWDALIKKYGLSVLDTVLLPTVWTFDQDDDTPYIFARLADSSDHLTTCATGRT